MVFDPAKGPAFGLAVRRAEAPTETEGEGERHQPQVQG